MASLLTECLEFVRYERNENRIPVAVFWDDVLGKEIRMTQDKMIERKKHLDGLLLMPESDKALKNWPEVL